MKTSLKENPSSLTQVLYTAAQLFPALFNASLTIMNFRSHHQVQKIFNSREIFKSN
jgi:hypothetical protein